MLHALNYALGVHLPRSPPKKKNEFWTPFELIPGPPNNRMNSILSMKYFFFTLNVYFKHENKFTNWIIRAIIPTRTNYL